MTTTGIRLIVLATVWNLEPATGYAIHKSLTDQGVESWGGISVASIYSALRTLTKHGNLEELADPTGVRENTKAYRVTDAGRRQFRTLWRSAIESIDPPHPLAFHVAITLTALVTRDDYISGLRRRLSELEQRQIDNLPSDTPPQTRHAARLWNNLAGTEAAWVRETIELAGRSDDLPFLPPSDHDVTDAPS